MATVVITQNESIGQAITEALEWLPLGPLVRGKQVAVKPNDTWASPQDTTGATQPDTLQAVAAPGRDWKRRLKRSLGSPSNPFGAEPLILSPSLGDLGILSCAGPPVAPRSPREVEEGNSDETH
jgi:hypothetical protein